SKRDWSSDVCSSDLSIVPDSGTPPPLADNLSRARKLVFSGRLLPRGEFVNGVASDSALAQSLGQFLANFRDFMPRLPRDGLTPRSEERRAGIWRIVR